MYYKITQLFLVFVLPFQLMAQKYRVSFEQRANFSIYNFSASIPYSTPSRDLSPRVGFESGLRFYYTPKEKITYYIGVGFTKYNYKTDKIKVRFSDQPTPGSGLQQPNEKIPSEIRYNYSYNYLSIPLGVLYKIKKRLHIGGGFKVLKHLSTYSYSKNYYTDEWLPQSNYDKKVFDNEGYSPWAINFDAEAGYVLPVLKYDITWKFAFEYAFTNYISNKHPALNLYPYTLSIGASLPLYSSKN